MRFSVKELKPIHLQVHGNHLDQLMKPSKRTCKNLQRTSCKFRGPAFLVTSDKKWIYLRNPNKSNQWLSTGQPAQLVLKRESFETKVMLLKEKYSALVNRNRVLLKQDNSKPHTSRRTPQKLEEFGGLKLLPHPAYSPDLISSDFQPFRSMAHFLSGRIFDNIADVEQRCRQFFASKPKHWYLKGIKNLSRQWQTTIDHNGIYFEY